MNRINQLFAGKQQDILSIYFTAGYPSLSDTATIIQAISAAGADMIEIGIPFSDPLADGPVIQHSSQVALENGMTLNLLLQQLAAIREKVHIPLLLMGYLNPILQFGVEAFCKAIASLGIDGVIIPDLPLREYELQYRQLFEQYNIKPVFLITPQTSEERMRKIDDLADSFIYMVTTAGTTGGSGDFTAETLAYFEQVRALGFRNPLMAGFGISNRQSFEAVTRYVNGGIIGTAFIKALEDSSRTIEDRISVFIKGVLKASVAV